jgi:hypothetical protein
MSNTDHFYASNGSFVKSFDKGDKPLPPARHALVLTCMDARLHPEKVLGLEVSTAGRCPDRDTCSHLILRVAAMPRRLPRR